MIGRPGPEEAIPYYFKYIDRIQTEDVVGKLESQLDEALALFRGVSEEKSLERYGQDKWSVRQVLNHVNDCERLFVYRALWFARGFESELPSFDQEVAAAGVPSDAVPWASHVEEFRGIRLGTVGFFRNLPPEAWMRSGIASGNRFTGRALAYIAAGPLAHQSADLREKYLVARCEVAVGYCAHEGPARLGLLLLGGPPAPPRRLGRGQEPAGLREVQQPAPARKHVRARGDGRGGERLRDP